MIEAAASTDAQRRDIAWAAVKQRQTKSVFPISLRHGISCLEGAFLDHFILYRQMIREQVAASVTAYPDHVGGKDMLLFLVRHQAVVPDVPALDAFAPQQDGLPPTELDIDQGQVVQFLVIVSVFVVLDKRLATSLKRAWQVVIFHWDAVLHGLVPAFDLALRLWIGWRPAGMLNAVP